jgi:hypothetical protein
MQGNCMWLLIQRVEGVPPSNRGQDARDTGVAQAMA